MAASNLSANKIPPNNSSGGKVGPPSWQTVNHKKRKLNPLSPPLTRNENLKQKGQTHVLTYNRFEGLFSRTPRNDEVINNTEKNDSSAKMPNKKLDIPPIVLHGIEDLNKLKQLIESSVEKEKYNISIGRNNSTRIKATTIDDYKLIISKLKDSGLLGHTFTPKSELPFRIVIRGIHPSISTKDIEEELTQAGHKIRGKIVAAKHRIHHTSLPIHFVSLKRAPNNAEIYQLHSVCHCSVRIEAPRKNTNIVQCQRCQLYGHTKSNCFRLPMCVKCGGNHLTTDCTKAQTIDKNELVCGLCNETGHPANYRGCRIYKEILTKRKLTTKTNNFRARATNKNTSENDAILPLNSDATKKSSYSSVARSGNKNFPESMPITTETSDMMKRLEKIVQDQQLQMQQILNQLGTLFQLITTLVNKIAK